MADSLTQHEAALRLSNDSGDQCTLFLSMSRVPESGDERQSEALDSQILEAHPDRLRFSHSNPMASQWDAAFRQIYRLFKVFNRSSVQVLHVQREFEISCNVQIRLLNIYRIQWYTYQTSQVPRCVLILRHLADHFSLLAMPNTTVIRSTSRSAPQYRAHGGESYPPVSTRSHALKERLYGWNWQRTMAIDFLDE